MRLRACMLGRFSRVRLCATLCTVACQASLSMVFSRPEYWSELPFPTPGDLPDPGIEPTSLCLLHWKVGSLPLAPPGKPLNVIYHLPEHSFGVVLPPSMAHPMLILTGLVLVSGFTYFCLVLRVACLPTLRNMWGLMSLSMCLHGGRTES